MHATDTANSSGTKLGRVVLNRETEKGFKWSQLEDIFDGGCVVLRLASCRDLSSTAWYCCIESNYPRSSFQSVPLRKTSMWQRLRLTTRHGYVGSGKRNKFILIVIITLRSFINNSFFVWHAVVHLPDTYPIFALHSKRIHQRTFVTTFEEMLQVSWIDCLRKAERRCKDPTESEKITWTINPGYW